MTGVAGTSGMKSSGLDVGLIPKPGLSLTVEKEVGEEGSVGAAGAGCRKEEVWGGSSPGWRRTKEKEPNWAVAAVALTAGWGWRKEEEEAVVGVVGEGGGGEEPKVWKVWKLEEEEATVGEGEKREETMVDWVGEATVGERTVCPLGRGWPRLLGKAASSWRKGIRRGCG